jgi:predicted NBD/HSP70 family sugar kinase
MALTIGVDVGGTKVAAGVVDDGGRILEKVRRPTPSTDPKEIAAVIAEVAHQCDRHEEQPIRTARLVPGRW